MTRLALAAAVLAAGVATSLATPLAAPLAGGATARAAAAPLPPAGHVFVVNLENKGYDETWGAASPAPYLAGELRAQGVLLTQYFGTAHSSLPNYLAQISGQGPNVQTQADCPVYTPFAGVGTAAPGQALGTGCVYPASVPTVADQLRARGLTWKGYLGDMGTPCRHPALGAPDDTQQAEVGDQYAARHNPFVYFASVLGTDCAQRDIDLSALPGDLAAVGTTPNLVYVTPNLCDDAHDAPCVDGRPGGLVSADAWLRTWIPRILASPAFAADGVLVVTFDESDGPQADSGACCGEGPGPNSPLPGITGPGGGRVGALVLSRYVRPGTTSATPYNHYSLLATVEDLFGLPRLGYAATARAFGTDVFAGSW